jgi:uncharacterized tellurite resistance protein B-like protein
MADWKKMLKEVVLADGSIDGPETAILSQEIMADGVVDSEEMEFLIELRSSAESVCDEFDQMFFTALQDDLLQDGAIDADEARRLREIIFADGKVEDNEKQFLAGLRSSATSVSPEFEQLCAECGV